MQPNGQLPPAPVNPYDAILNPAASPKKPLLGGNKPKPLIMVLFVLFVLLIVVAAVALFSSLTSKDYSGYTALAQRQQEIIRVSALGLKDAKDPATLTYLATVHSVTQSEQSDTIAFLDKKDVTLKSVTLNLKKDTDTDKALATAAQNNTYDTAVMDKVNELLASYRKAASNVNKSVKTKSEKTLLATLTANAKTIAPAQ